MGSLVRPAGSARRAFFNALHYGPIHSSLLAPRGIVRFRAQRAPAEVAAAEADIPAIHRVSITRSCFRYRSRRQRTSTSSIGTRRMAAIWKFGVAHPRRSRFSAMLFPVLALDIPADLKHLHEPLSGVSLGIYLDVLQGFPALASSGREAWKKSVFFSSPSCYGFVTRAIYKGNRIHC